MAMGMAEVVPGVSGGTIAFITGIYERLINVINSINLAFFKKLFTGKWKSAFQQLDGKFLATLLFGMVLGIGVAIFTVVYLLETYPPVIWAFFFGLIIASAIYIFRQIENRNIYTFLWTILGIAISILICNLVPAQGNESLWYVFLCGMIAFCALVLPGVSGSFMLLLLGMYTVIMPNVKLLIEEQDLSVLPMLIVFGLGGITGLMLFSRLLSYTFKTYKNSTLAVLCGFIIGSLWKIWPWRNPLIWMDADESIHDVAMTEIQYVQIPEFKALKEVLVLPQNYISEPYLLPAIAACLLGFCLVFVMDRSSKNS